MVRGVSFARGRGNDIFAIDKINNKQVMKFEREHRFFVQYATAVGMLVSGVALTVAGFMTPPVGEISDSVLWFAAQTMIYAGSVFGVSIYVNDRITGLKDRISKLESNEKNK